MHRIWLPGGLWGARNVGTIGEAKKKRQTDRPDGVGRIETEASSPEFYFSNLLLQLLRRKYLFQILMRVAVLANVMNSCADRFLQHMVFYDQYIL